MSLETTSLPEEATKHLEEFYRSNNATDSPASIKIELLKRTLGGEIHFYACGGEVTEEMMLGNLEHDFLCEEGVLKRILC